MFRMDILICDCASIAARFTSVPAQPLCPLSLTRVRPHSGCPSHLGPWGPFATLSKQLHTIPFMEDKARVIADFSLLFSTFVTCISDPLCSSYLCMHQLLQIEPTIEMEIIPTSQWLQGSKFLLLEALLWFLLFLRESYVCVALFTTVLPSTLNSEDM